MDSYQPIFDAIRSRINSCDVGEIIRQQFDMSGTVAVVSNELRMHLSDVATESQRPSVLFRPDLNIDGNQWFALYGKDLQSGMAGFGDSPEQAMVDFDKNWRQPLS